MFCHIGFCVGISYFNANTSDFIWYMHLFTIDWLWREVAWSCTRNGGYYVSAVLGDNSSHLNRNAFMWFIKRFKKLPEK